MTTDPSTFSELLKAAGEFERLINEVPAIHPEKGIERGESSALVPIGKGLRPRDAYPEQRRLPDYVGSLVVRRRLGPSQD
jgi:hypothetical protein